MKFNKYSIIAFALSAVMIFAGCEFQGTKAKFKGDEETDYNAVLRSVSLPGDIIIDNSGYVDLNVKNAEVRFVIISNGALDEDSIEEACNFYTVAKNGTDPENFYPVISATPMTKTLKSIDVSKKAEDSDGSSESAGICDFNSLYTRYYNPEVIITVVTYELDTTGITTDKIAFIADATTLKEKSKAYVLNFDGNDECGEESDSIIRFYDVDNSGGTLTEIPISSVKKAAQNCYAPTFNLAVVNYGLEPQAEGLPKLVFECAAPYYNKNGTPVYGENFADVISKIYSYRFLPLGEKKWQSVPVTVTYNTTTHNYEGKSDPIPTGTYYTYGVENDNSITWDAAAEAFGGRAPRLGYVEDSDHYFIWEDGISWYYNTEPDYMVSAPDARDTTNAATVVLKPAPYITDSSIQSVQAGILDYTFLSNGIIKISINDNYKDNYNIRFGATDGFVITVRNNGKAGAVLDSKVIKTSETEVSIQLDNQYYDMSDSTLMIWVGYDTTIKANKLYPKQTHFGCLGADLDNIANAMPGYVCIN